MNHAVVMAGGGGTRLWPASRRRRPKQLLTLGRNETLLGATCRRMAQVVGPGRTMVVTAADQAEAVARALPELAPGDLLAEPCPRNTAAAVGLAATVLLARDPDAVLCAVPADHHVGDEAGFREVVARAYRLAAAGDAIVTIGIRPTRPDTGFGYLELGAPGPAGTRLCARFVEKPDRARAEEYVRRGHLWNGGIFFFRAPLILAEIERLLPDLAAGLAEIRAALARGPEDFRRELARIYPGLPSISIDFGVMERTKTRILTLPGDFGWSDIGSWTALAELRAPDAAGNVVEGRALAVDATDNVVSTDEGVVALIGVSGLVVVRSGDAVLVVPRGRAQDVREVVRRLELEGDDGLL